jgi:hypothetical protein
MLDSCCFDCRTARATGARAAFAGQSQQSKMGESLLNGVSLMFLQVQVACYQGIERKICLCFAQFNWAVAYLPPK